MMARITVYDVRGAGAIGFLRRLERNPGDQAAVRGLVMALTDVKSTEAGQIRVEMS